MIATWVARTILERTGLLLFSVAIFTSAALIFFLEPMVARLVLPRLGGSPAVWNTCMAFYQTALLAGYGYAHLMQRLRAVRTQALVHMALLLLAALTLPLHISALLGDPRPGAPIRWLLPVLVISVGAPFAILSATAPLLQAWYARLLPPAPGRPGPYALYAASNLGSFAALILYPILVEPLLRLSQQRFVWTLGYGLFCLVAGTLALLIARAEKDEGRSVSAANPPKPAATGTGSSPDWRTRLIWVALAAGPSSLMLGVTTHLTTDVASAPFLWVAPLALYLLTFVFAFSERRILSWPALLVLQAAFVAAAVSLAPFTSMNWAILLVADLCAFFFTALLCHQTLADRRPDPATLTEFFLWLSVGGVVGGVFNALLAPVLFKEAIEYSLVLVLCVLARPWGRGPLSRSDMTATVAAAVPALVAAVLFPILNHDEGLQRAFVIGNRNWDHGATLLAATLLGAASTVAIILRGRAVLFAGLMTLVAIAAHGVAGRYLWIDTERSFFGVIRSARYDYGPYEGPVTMLLHGTTLHGAQARNPRFACHPMTYYAETTPLGQAMLIMQKRRPRLDVGVVGLGTGALAAYSRSRDHVTYFEIDPKVLKFAMDPSRFRYIKGCARGPVKVRLSDARLTLAGVPSGAYDIVFVDAFSSDSVPTHLLTQEAIGGYLRVLKPDGVVVLHLSNRNLEITTPAVASVRALGAPALHQIYIENPKRAPMWEASTEALVVGRSEAALADFRSDPRWRSPPVSKARPWTDDYVDLFGALWRDLTGAR